MCPCFNDAAFDTKLCVSNGQLYSRVWSNQHCAPIDKILELNDFYRHKHYYPIVWDLEWHLDKFGELTTLRKHWGKTLRSILLRLLFIVKIRAKVKIDRTTKSAADCSLPSATHLDSSYATTQFST